MSLGLGKGAEFKKFSSETIVISNSAPSWLKVLSWMATAFFLIMLFQPELMSAQYSGAGKIIISLIWILLMGTCVLLFALVPNIAYTTQFDMPTRSILHWTILFGVTIRRLMLPFDTVKLLGVIRHNRSKGVEIDSYRLFLQDRANRQYIVAVFFYTGDYEKFLDKLLSVVPLAHPGPLRDKYATGWRKYFK